MMKDAKAFPVFRSAAAASLAGALLLSGVGCKSKSGAAPVVDGTAQNSGADPADANMAQPGGTGQAQVLGQSESYNGQSSGESYQTQTPAPIIRQGPANAGTQYYPVPQAGNGQVSYSGQGQYDGSQQAYNQGYSDAEEAGEQALADTSQPPPPLPEYDQPPAPADNYLWTPGYWNYASTGYYWVPGVWCAPPFIGALWTPPWWGYGGGRWLFHRGYWGPHIGYYGGINYGYGYVGSGYYGGYWHGRDFYYNRSVTNVNVVNVHNVYNRTVVYNGRTYGPQPFNRTSYNGGRGGLTVQPRPQEIAAMHEAHYAPVAAQRENRTAAAGNRGQFFAANGGRPAEAFAARPAGNVGSIPSAPREQAFNHPGTAQPGIRPGAQPEFRARPGTVSQPGAAGRPGIAGQPALNNRVGEGNSSTAAGQPGTVSRPGEPNRAGEFGRPAATQPERTPGNFGRPAENNGRPAAQPGFNRPNAPSQPAFNRPAPEQRPAAPAAQPAQARPEFQPRQAQPEARPEFNRPSAPAPEVRPAAPAARPEAPAARPAGGGGAPHGGGGGEHGHH